MKKGGRHQMSRFNVSASIVVFILLYINFFFIPHSRNSMTKIKKKNALRTESSEEVTWTPGPTIVKFPSCDVPCYFDRVIPLVGRKTVFDDRGRSSTFMHTMEGPLHYPRSTNRGTYDALSTVSMKSDVPLPYFSWAEYNIKSPPVDFDSAIKGSVFIARNCRSLNDREGLIKSLSNLTRVDSVSSCLNNSPWPSDVPRSEKHLIMKRYLFYFAFENECSEDYMTEKLWGALESGSLPVYFGAPNVLDYVPPKSIIDVNQFRDTDGSIDVMALSELLNSLVHDKDEYMAYHKWRSNPDYPSFFKTTYDFTHDHSICRSCRWNLARHEPFRYHFDQRTQKLITMEP